MKYRFVAAMILSMAFCAVAAQTESTNIADLYRTLSFDPGATNCATLVHISDIHISLCDPIISQIPVTTNLDPRLVSMVNTLQPGPGAIAITGDLGFIGGVAPGFGPTWPEGTQEVAIARQELVKLTNCEAMYIVPGNHDSVYGREDGFIFTNVFVGFSRYTNFTLAGLPVFMLDSQNGGWIDDEQHDWLAGWRGKLDRSKSILVMSHFPISGPLSTYARELGREILWFVDKWQAPVWLGTGHNHCRGFEEYGFGTTKISQYITPSVNWHISPDTNYWSCLAAGFAVWCITNGSVKGIISGVFTNGSYYLFKSGAQNDTTCRPYENLTNVLFHAEEGHFDRAAYSVAVSGSCMRDVGYFWNYPEEYICELPFASYPSATRAYCLTIHTNGVQYYFAHDTNSWSEVPAEFFLDGVTSVVVPQAMRSSPLWFRVTLVPDNMFGGFGLGATNEMSEFSAWAGKTLGDANLKPESQLPWGGPVWQAYMLGVSSAESDPLCETTGAPWLGGWPSRTGDTVRFGARTSLVYTVQQSTTTAGPWSPTAVSWGRVTNGWQEGTITNAGSLTFRISAKAR